MCVRQMYIYNDNNQITLPGQNYFICAIQSDHMHQIENQTLRLRAREYGAEMISLFYKPTQTEHIWQADPAGWGWHAPLLFPVVGRCLNDEILVNGVKYPMAKHGFARKRNFRLLEVGDTRLVFELVSNTETLAQFPYPFELLVGYHLSDNQVEVRYEVINTGTETMHFCIGGHPAFNVPFYSNEQRADYLLEFSEEETASRHHIDSNGFFDGRKTQVLNNSNVLPIADGMFNDDALIFKDLKSKTVTIKTPKHKHQLSCTFKDYPYLGIWSNNDSKFVCIEPWYGCADSVGGAPDFSRKEGVQTLAAGQRFYTCFIITISEG